MQSNFQDDVVDFLQLYCSSSTTHSYRLHPLKLVEVNDVDLSILRTSNLFSGSQAKSTKSGFTLKTSKGEHELDKYVFELMLFKNILQVGNLHKNFDSEFKGKWKGNYFFLDFSSMFSTFILFC